MGACVESWSRAKPLALPAVLVGTLAAHAPAMGVAAAKLQTALRSPFQSAASAAARCGACKVGGALTLAWQGADVFTGKSPGRAR